MHDGAAHGAAARAEALGVVTKERGEGGPAQRAS